MVNPDPSTVLDGDVIVPDYLLYVKIADDDVCHICDCQACASDQGTLA